MKTAIFILTSTVVLASCNQVRIAAQTSPPDSRPQFDHNHPPPLPSMAERRTLNLSVPEGIPTTDPGLDIGAASASQLANYVALRHGGAGARIASLRKIPFDQLPEVEPELAKTLGGLGRGRNVYVAHLEGSFGFRRHHEPLHLTSIVLALDASSGWVYGLWGKR